VLDEAAARRAFASHFGAEPDVVVRSPGRVNLIGEHVDYNDGLVLPAAIDRGTLVCVKRRDDARVRAFSADLPGELDVSLTTVLERPAREPVFGPYARGVLGMLPHDADACGFSLSFMGDLPVGAGLSSSASLEVGVAVAVQALGAAQGWQVCTPLGIAQLCQRAENEVAGVRSGIMDQLAVAAGVEGHALLIDCLSLEVRPARFPKHARLLILDSAAPRTLAGSAYNERRAQCEAAAGVLGMSLREAADRRASLSGLSGVLLMRARHVVTEIARTRNAAEALARGALGEAGELMNASHESLRADYQVSSDALDVLVHEARLQPGVLGARLTGAGFGGCVVVLAEANAPAVGDEGASILERYRARTGLTGRGFVVRPSHGAHVVTDRPSAG
jgi:galactokinase